MAGALDFFADSPIARWVMQQAALREAGGMDEAGFNPAFQMPVQPQVAAPAAAPGIPAAAPGIPAGLLASLGSMGAPGGFDALDAKARQGVPRRTDAPVDTDETAGFMLPPGAGSRDRDPFTFGAQPIPGVDAVAGILSGNLPPTNDPTSFEPKMDVPLPRSRPGDLDAPQSEPGAPLSLSPADYNDQLPANAKPTAAKLGAAAPEGPGFLESLGKKIFDPNKAATWLALGSGFSGAPSLGTGMRRGFSAAVPAMAADRAQITRQTTIADTYRALVAKGVPPAEALAASQNPEIMKTIAAKYFDDQLVPHEVGTDWLGNKIMGSFHKRSGKYYDTAGREISAPGQAGVTAPGAGGGAAGIGGGLSSPLAKGVTEYNGELPPDQYLSQFSPEVQSAIKAYAEGRTQPTGNPRLKGFDTKIKEWARLYGDKTGVPVSDAEFSQRRKYRTELGSASANTAGGQAKAFTQGIEHAEALAKKLEQLGNVDPVGIPVVAQGLNWMHQAFSTKQTGIAKEAAAIGQTLAGEVGKLFSGSQGGGVHERELTRQRFNTITSPNELAGALEATLETMEGGLRALESRRDAIMGPNSDVVISSAETQKKIDNIRDSIRRLKGGEAAPSAAPSAGKTSKGITWSISPQPAGP